MLMQWGGWAMCIPSISWGILEPFLATNQINIADLSLPRAKTGRQPQRKFTGLALQTLSYSQSTTDNIYYVTLREGLEGLAGATWPPRRLAF